MNMECENELTSYELGRIQKWPRKFRYYFCRICRRLRSIIFQLRCIKCGGAFNNTGSMWIFLCNNCRAKQYKDDQQSTLREWQCSECPNKVWDRRPRRCCSKDCYKKRRAKLSREWAKKHLRMPKAVIQTG